MDKGRELPDFAKVLIFIGVLVIGFWLLSSCVDKIAEEREEREAEVYAEAYREGWYDGQWELIESIREYKIYEAPNADDMASELLNGWITKKQFVEKYEKFLEYLKNMEPVER